MRRRPQELDKRAIAAQRSLLTPAGNIGIVLSGGGSRAAYQVGALRALIPYFSKTPDQISTVMGSSIGAINGLVLSACLKKGIEQSIEQLEMMWRERTFRNTFTGTPSGAFMRAIKIAYTQYRAPGPSATSASIFDPTPLMMRVDQVLNDFGGLSPEARHPSLQAVGVMTTMEGAERKPMLFMSSHRKLDAPTLEGASFEVCYVDNLSAKHGFASAALPSVLPPVEIDTEHGKVRLVDGGISQNIPVDPAVRVGAERVIVIDISGRSWWLDHYGESHDTRPTWEVPAAMKTFCLRPPETFVVRPAKALGPLLRLAVQGSTRKFITAVGPVWPVFQLLKKKLGEEIAYEVMTYAALDPDYLSALMECGYNETSLLLKNKTQVQFNRPDSYESWAQAL
ncbi:MAG: patatin-like phospholipase family protein [Deltaproteobacteria bacterium]|nr:patatin-like phospholipase family protein [Deltaproteobacteria bacterium]